MSNPARFLFDECVGKPVMQRLAEILAATQCHCEFQYLADIEALGESDRDWIPRIANEGWIVVSADRGKQTKGGTKNKLPDICLEFGVTHVLFGSSIHHLPANQKLRLLIGAWDGILLLAGSPRGTRIFLNRNDDGNCRTKVDKNAKPRVKLQQQELLPDQNETQP